LSALSPIPEALPAPPRRERRLVAVEDPAPDFELLFRSGPSLLVVLEPSPDLRIVAATDAYLRATRSVREAVVGRPFFEAFPERSEGRRPLGAGSLRSALERVAATGRPDALNTPVHLPDGRLRYIIHRMDALDVEFLRCAGERDDARRQLEGSARDLEAFMASVSRDLRAPLRAIDGLTRIFSQLHGAFVNGETRRLLARIGAHVNRMETIIDGLLGLSRIGRIHMARKHIDVTEVAHRVAARLRSRDPERHVAIDVAEGLEAWADESLVSIILDNLMGNAWKYTRRRDDPRIEVGARRSGGRLVFYVSDNGVGFDMARADKLFAPFVRLHDSTDFEGHGIGLTSAKRIVERHGGEIWAEAQVDQGTTIHFTLGPAD